MTTSTKRAIITGGTSGIGKVTVLELAKQGVHIVLPARDLSKAEQVKQEVLNAIPAAQIDIYYCDFMKLQTVKEFAENIKKSYQQIDILVNNAGIWFTEFQLTEDGYEATWQVNHLAPFLLTNLLMEMIVATAPARIVNTSSAAHMMGKIDFSDLQCQKKYTLTKAYAQSKLANLLFTKQLSVILKDKQVTANCLHPGVVKTALFNHMNSFMQMLINWFLITPEKGARTTIYLATSDKVSTISGEYFSKCKVASTAPAGRDMAVAQKLWEVSIDQVKKFL